MSIVDDLIENLVERNAIDLNGTFSIALIDGGLRIRGTLMSAVRDEKRKKQILKIDVPVDVQVSVGEIVIPLPQLK
jgi:hypothetical protein